MNRRWDIFCAVVDNYGDAGVCWRLARQLAAERGQPVRLWIDDVAPLARLCPEVRDGVPDQVAQGVEVRAWTDDFPTDAVPADVVIEAFACELPPSYLAAMAAEARAGRPPCWINLEYLSAEDWVDGCHRLASPHPTLPLTKHFFFPGFGAATGGLLREHDYAARRAAFDPAAFRAGLGLPPAPTGGLTVSLFAYDNPALESLLDAWAAAERPVQCLLPEGLLLPRARAWVGAAADDAGPWRRGALEIRPLPFLSQSDYDKLLWLCDLNFVRGEDSFVRAQWAAKPFVWHIYPQDEGHHRVKLRAFLARYRAGLDAATDTALTAFWEAWEGMVGGADVGDAWPALAASLPALQDHARAWARQMSGQPDLVSRLLSFVMESR